MKVAVSGANGYLGSHVVEKLLKYGHEVVAIDVKFDNISADVERVNENIFSSDESIFHKLGEPDCLIHLAWRDGFNHASLNHMGDLSNHYKFLINMLNGGLTYLSVMGSMHEVGYHEGEINENTICNPMSQYGVAKNSLREALIDIISRNYKTVAFHWLRGFYIIGDDIKSNSIFAKIINAEKRGDKLFPFTSGVNKYDFIDIDTMAEQIALASTQNEICGIINCCSGVPVSLGEKVEEFIKNNNFKIKLEYNAFPDRVYDSPIIYGDNSKINTIMSHYKKN